MKSRNTIFSESKRGQLTGLLNELPYLLYERSWSKQELAHHFGVSARTIKRAVDMLTLREPILEMKSGREIHYQLKSSSRFSQPQFTPVEIATLLLAQQAIGATGLTSFGTPFAAHARSLLAKARAALPAALHPKLDALAAIFGSATVPAKDFTPHAGTIDQLVEATVAQTRVRLRYHSLHNDRIADRDFDPYAVYFDPDGATLKVLGYDHNSGEIRPLSVDHVRSLAETGETFTRPPGFTLQGHLDKYCFNGIHGEPIRVRLRAHGIAARVFAERTFHSSQIPIERTGETTTIEMCVAQGRGLTRFILSWTPDIEVLDPPELRDELRTICQRAIARFAGGEEKI